MLLQFIEIENALGGLRPLWLHDRLHVVILLEGIIFFLNFFLGSRFSKRQRLENILVFGLIVLLLGLLDAFHKHLLLLLFLQALDLPLPHEKLLNKL